MTTPNPKVETVTASDRPSVSINAPSTGWGAVGVDTPQAAGAPVMDLRDVSVFYGNYEAVRGTSMPIRQNQITAMIGPSGCGKSTILRSLNRMNDLVPGARVAGKVTYHGQDLYAKDVDPIQVRRRIGMVFQKPNPFPKSIFDNVAYGLRINGIKGNLHDQVEEALTGAALWDEVKDKLKQSGLSLSGGQQQRLCIARTIAVRPDVILMDEPCSALDPIATGKIEDLMHELTKSYTIVIVTHNMQQAARVSHYTAFFTAEVDEKQVRHGRLVEFSETGKLFTNPSDKRTEDYITGRFG
ncbi:phosphate ABC transporter ATP-binding protein PstB [Phytohabitans suffuscus]|uniref:Phosphate import ATP-binding protein PstB n=1 Tax=Phytohabitans suffuscus TaxID=624315 RepID=A0A6F8YHA1_9ACTN|nr:phosphate import ATP-binding protein PstB [Phytohabitans suffuscus]